MKIKCFYKIYQLHKSGEYRRKAYTHVMHVENKYLDEDGNIDDSLFEYLIDYLPKIQYYGRPITGKDIEDLEVEIK